MAKIDPNPLWAMIDGEPEEIVYRITDEDLQTFLTKYEHLIKTFLKTVEAIEKSPEAAVELHILTCFVAGLVRISNQKILTQLESELRKNEKSS